MKLDDAEKQSRFMTHFNEAVEKMVQIVNERQETYNTSKPVQDHLTSPIVAYQMAKLKVSRAEDQLHHWVGEATSESRAALQDSLLDAMAYLAFTYSWMEEPGWTIPDEVH